ncbi:MAG: hypothetical protein LBF61_06010 [Azoarcus sp.]|jgi:hypothetical protein|nr:hypothetical protein [Azoarcus sp.]
MTGTRQTQVSVRDKDGELFAQQQESDTPFLPVQQLERPHAFRPDLVNWVVQETEREAAYHRRTNLTINRYVFIERMAGMFFACGVGLVGIIGGGYVALHEQPWAGATIAGAMIGSLAVAFLRKGGREKGGDS